MTLHLSLKKQWYDMIACGIKKEEYREITPYWMKRLCWDDDYDEPVCKEDCEYLCNHLDCAANMFLGGWKPRPYTEVHFTLGYPRRDDTDRHMSRRIASINIGEGNPEWGAEKGKLYFVIKLK